MENEHMKRCSTSYVIKEMQINMTMRYLYTFIRRAKIRNTDTTKCCSGCGAIGTLIHCWRECKMVQPLWRTVKWFLRRLNTFLQYDTAIISNHAPWHLPKAAQNLCPYKHLPMNVDSSFVHNYSNLEATTISLSRWMDK